MNIIAGEDVTYAVAKRKPEKIQVCQDLNPNLTLISVSLLQHSNQMSRFSEIQTLISVLLVWRSTN